MHLHFELCSWCRGSLRFTANESPQYIKPRGVARLCLLRVSKSSAMISSGGFCQMRNSEVGGNRVCKDRAPHPGSRFVPSACSCAQCYSYRTKMRQRGPDAWHLFLNLETEPFFSRDGPQQINVGCLANGCLSQVGYHSDSMERRLWLQLSL